MTAASGISTAATGRPMTAGAGAARGQQRIKTPMGARGGDRPMTARSSANGGDEAEKSYYGRPPRPMMRPQNAGRSTMEVIEQKLRSSIMKLDGLRNENGELRRRIDHTRCTKMQVLVVNCKLIECVRSKYRDLHAIKEAVVESNEILEHIGERKNGLKKSIVMERKSFHENVIQLNDDFKISDLEKKKSDVKQKRIDEIELAQHRHEYVTTEEERDFSPTDMMRKIVKAAFLNTIQRRNTRRHIKNIEVFEQAFLTIKSSTGISDVEEIVKIFSELEGRNYSLLTFMNGISREIEWYEGYQKQSLAMQTFLDRENYGHTTRKNQVLKTYMEELNKYKGLADNFGGRNKRHEAIFHGIFPKISLMRDGIMKISMKTSLFKDLISRDKQSRAPEALNEEFIIPWLVWLERIFYLWRDFLPKPKGHIGVVPVRPFPHTAGSAIKESLSPKKQISLSTVIPDSTLLRANELPSFDDHKDEEEDDRVLTMEEIKQRVQKQTSVRQTKKFVPKQQAKGAESDASPSSPSAPRAWDYDEMVAPPLSQSSSEASSEASVDDDRSQNDLDVPTNDELNSIFLKRYKMSRAELKCMSEKLGLKLSHLCYLKQEFDNYDIDKSGYIDTSEFNLLLEKLGEEMTEQQLEAVFREFDADKSGEIEFFEFVRWFVSSDVGGEKKEKKAEK